MLQWLVFYARWHLVVFVNYFLLKLNVHLARHSTVCKFNATAKTNYRIIKLVKYQFYPLSRNNLYICSSKEISRLGSYPYWSSCIYVNLNPVDHQPPVVPLIFLECSHVFSLVLHTSSACRPSNVTVNAHDQQSQLTRQKIHLTPPVLPFVVWLITEEIKRLDAWLGISRLIYFTPAKISTELSVKENI